MSEQILLEHPMIFTSFLFWQHAVLLSLTRKTIKMASQDDTFSQPVTNGRHSTRSYWLKLRTLMMTKFQTHKAGDLSSLPANFRPFALTSCIGKVFHKITAKHLERYLSPTTSLSHQFRKASSVKSMVQWNIHFTWVPYWKTPEPTVPIFATFLDLKNAFGFVPHALIVDMFHYIWLPLDVTSYICGQLVFQGPGCCII